VAAPSASPDGSDDDTPTNVVSSSEEEAWTPTEICSPPWSQGSESGSIVDSHDENGSAHAPPHAKLHHFTPRRARSAVESQKAQVALDQANAALARLSPPPSPSLSPEQAPMQVGNDVLADVAAQSKHVRGDKSFDESALTKSNEKIQLEHEARRADELAVALQCLKEENARLSASLKEASARPSQMQPSTACHQEPSESKGEQTRKMMEAKLRFLEEEVETANAELSRTKAKLSASDIELQVLRAQFEKMAGEPRDDLYSTSSSRAVCSASDAMRRQDMEAQMNIAEAERCALEKVAMLI